MLPFIVQSQMLKKCHQSLGIVEVAVDRVQKLLKERLITSRVLWHIHPKGGKSQIDIYKIISGLWILKE